MKTIWKFRIDANDFVSIPMPKGARLLTVQTQGLTQLPMLWAVVDEEAPTVKRTIAIRGTGHPANGCEAMPYISTFQLGDGALVFHAFDAGES